MSHLAPSQQGSPKLPQAIGGCVTDWGIEQANPLEQWDVDTLSLQSELKPLALGQSDEYVQQCKQLYTPPGTGISGVLQKYKLGQSVSSVHPEPPGGTVGLATTQLFVQVVIYGRQPLGSTNSSFGV